MAFGKTLNDVVSSGMAEFSAINILRHQMLRRS